MLCYGFSRIPSHFWSRFRVPYAFGLFLLIVWGLWGVSSALPWKRNETLWKHAIDVSPKASVAWNEWGNVLLKKREFRKAKEAFDQAVLLHPEYQTALLNGILVQYRLGELSLASKDLKAHVHRFPNDAGAWDLWGSVAQSQQRYGEALEASTKAVEHEPGNWRYRYNMGTTLLKMGRFEFALKEFEIAQDLTQARSEVFMHLAVSHYYLGHWSKAKVLYEQVLDQWPSHNAARTSLNHVEKLLTLQEGSRLEKLE